MNVSLKAQQNKIAIPKTARAKARGQKGDVILAKHEG